MKKYTWQIILFIVLVVILASCSTSLRTRYYTIKEIRGLNTVVFKEVEGDWHVPGSDTLNVGQKIFLQRVWSVGKANVW